MKNRIVFLFILIFFAFMGLIGRGAYLQLYPNQKLSERVNKQFQTKITLQSRRGAILDREDRELAISVTSYSIYADPMIVKNKDKAARKLSKILKPTYAKMRKRLSRPRTRFIWLDRQVSKEKRDQVMALNLQGIGIVEEPKRIYPNNHLASHILGFVGREGKGLEGVELALNEDLTGENKKYFVKRDARGRPLMMDLQSLNPPNDGEDIRVSLDSELQYMLEKKLQRAMTQHQAEKAVGVILDANTSEVLAIANTPSFDANSPFNVPPGYRRNSPIVDAFEPGSTFKTFAIAAALSEGMVQPNTKIDCEDGRFRIGRRIIREADAQHNFKELTVSEVLAKSSNVGSSKIALKVGAKKYRAFLQKLGFGQKASIEFPGVSSGILHPLPWGQHQLANISFGHGVTASALQIAAAYAAIANGGVYRSPTLLKDKMSPPRQVLEPEIAHQVKLMLMGATSRSGTGYSARIPGFPIGGKTGTAQKVDFKNGGYLKGEYVASFAGFVPANDPQYVIYIAVDNPKEKFYGSEVAAPVFSEVARYVMQRSGMQPILISDKNLLDKKWDSFQWKEPPPVQDELMSAAFAATEEGVLPQLKGLTLRQALSASARLKIPVKIKGRGRVDYTVPGAGVKLDDDLKQLTLVLSE